MMYQLGTGILPNSICVPLTPTAQAQSLYFYPVLCGHYFCDIAYSVERNFYENPLLMFVRQGILVLQYCGMQYRAEKGDVLLLDCSKPHQYAATGDLEFLYLHFDGCNSHALVQELIKDTPLFRKAENLIIGEKLYDAIYTYAHHGISSAAEESMRIYQFLIWLAISQKTMVTPDDPINQTIQYIRGNIGQAITLSELAHIARLSPCHYSHEFKRRTGFSPMEYVINTRLEKAKMLLLQTKMNVMEIAFEVGYQSGSSLSSLFIKKTGSSPREYRRSNGVVE